MATLPPRELKIGTIIDKTLGVVEVAAMPALIVPAAPTRLSMMTCWPQGSLSLAPTRRATMSVAVPGVNPTI